MSHETHSGRHPSWCGSRYTMPQRETVAGDATARSATSKIMFIDVDMAMISPSSGTASCCRRAPCSCSRSKWRRRGRRTSPTCGRAGVLRAARGTRPPDAVLPLVRLGSICPYSCPIVIDFGFMHCTRTSPVLLAALRHLATARAPGRGTMHVLPPNGCPTIMSPWRTTIISYSWIVFRKKYGSGWRFISAHASCIASPCSRSPLREVTRREQVGDDALEQRHVLAKELGHRFTSMMRRSMSTSRPPPGTAA